MTVDGVESRWLSLPRVSEEVQGKRPDHVVQIFPEGSPRFTLSIESKDRAQDLEVGVGDGLKRYLTYLVGHLPSATRSAGAPWARGAELAAVLPENIVSAAAYITQGEDADAVFAKTNCQLLVELKWSDESWQVKFRNMGAPQWVMDELRTAFAQTEEIGGIRVSV